MTQVRAMGAGQEEHSLLEVPPAAAGLLPRIHGNELGGTWSPMPQPNSQQTPFAGQNNVTFPGGKWTNDISHGDIVRDNPSEKQEIDPCNLQFLYQGADPNFQGGYGDIPYHPGLLTLVE